MTNLKHCPENCRAAAYLAATPWPLKFLRILLRCAVASWRARFAMASSHLLTSE